MENKPYKDTLEECKQIQEQINLRTPFIKKMKKISIYQTNPSIKT